MKKIISMLLCFTILFAGIGYTFADTTVADTEQIDYSWVEQYSEYVGILKEAGLFLESDIKPEQLASEVTRAQFAKLILITVGFDEAAQSQSWADEFMSDDDSEVALESIFSDVPTDHEYYREIMQIAKLGIMGGTSSSTFEPDRKMTFSEMVKVLISIMGYEDKAKILGGYPHGYMSIYTDLGLMSDFSKNYNDAVTLAELSKLFVVSFEADGSYISQISDGSVYYSADKSKNAFKQYFDIEIEEGIVTSNTITSLTEGKKSSKSCIVVNGVTYVSEKLDWDNFIAQSVKVYYKDVNSQKTIVYVSPLYSEITKIDARDIVEYAGNKLTYSNENGKLKKIDIPNGVPVIYNGVAVRNYTTSIFSFTNGSVEVVDNSGKKEAVIIWDYDTVIPSSTDADRQFVYNDLRTEPNTVDLNPSDNVAKIYRGNSTATFEEINENTVLSVARNEHSVVVRICEEIVSGEYKAKTSDGKVTIGEKAYYLSEGFINSLNYQEIPIGKKVIARLNTFGDVAFMEEDTASGGQQFKSGFLITAANKGAFDPYQLKLFCTESSVSEVRTKTFADRIVVYKEDGTTIRCENSNILGALGGYTGFVRYKTDAKNVNIVTEVEIPMDKDRNLKDRAYCLLETTAANRNLYMYRKSQKSFSHKMYLADDAVIYNLPTDLSEEEDYQILGTDYMEDNSTYVFKSYATSPGSLSAEYMVLNVPAVTASYGTATVRLGVVKSVFDGILENGEVVKKVVITENGNVDNTIYSKYEYDAKCEEGSAYTMFDVVPGAYNVKSTDEDPVKRAEEEKYNKYYQLKVGDIVYYKFDSLSKEVLKMTYVYDPDIPSGGAAPDGNIAYVIDDEGKKYDKYYIDSSLVNYDAETHDLFAGTSSDKEPLKNGNPFGLGDSSPNANAHRITASERFMRTSLSYVYDRVGNNLYLTTQNIIDEAYAANGLPAVEDTIVVDGKSYTGIYVTDTFDFTKFSPRLLVEYYPNNKVVTRQATADDIRGYLASGNACSRVITNCNQGYARQIVVINDYR